MKKLLIALITTLSLTACNLNGITANDLKLDNERVIIVEGKTKQEIFDNVADYFATNWNDSKEVLQRTDEKRGRIIARGHFGYYNDMTARITVKGTIQVDVKDGKARILLTAVENTNQHGTQWGMYSAESMQAKNDNVIHKLFDEFELALNTQTSNNENW